MLTNAQSLMTALAALLISSGAMGSTVLTATADDVGDGLTRWTINLSTTDDKLIGSIGLTFSADSMSQQQPFDVPTVFQDYNSFITAVGMDVNKDSQFLFTYNGGSNLYLSPDGAAESNTMLRASFTILGTGTYVPFQSRDIAQVVVPSGHSIAYDGVVVYAQLNGLMEELSGIIPEPTSLMLLGVGLVSLYRRAPRA